CHHAGRGLARAGVDADRRPKVAGRFRVGRTAVIAEHGHHVPHADAAGALLEQLPAALAAGLPAGLRMLLVFAPIASKVQPFTVTERAAGEVEFVADAWGIRD